mgnify:CR=1 FL=1
MPPEAAIPHLIGNAPEVRMRIAKAHQQPYRGFAWDHPLRQLFRKAWDDPLVSKHPVYYIFQATFFWLVSFIALGLAIWAWITITPRSLTSVLLAIVLGFAVESIAILGSSSLHSEAARIFDVRMEEIAKALGISLETMAAYTHNWLRAFAVERLIEKARAVVDIERETGLCPFDPARARAKREFEEAYQLFKDWCLIKDTGYATYFNHAAKP